MDAAFTAHSAGIGGVIKNHSREVCVVFIKGIVQSLSPEHAEAISICEGLKAADRFGFSTFSVKGDYNSVVNQLRSRSGQLGRFRNFLLSN